jgi:hypothetical protein
MRELIAGVSGPTSAVGVPLALALIAVLMGIDLRSETGRPVTRVLVIGAVVMAIALIGVIVFRFAKIAA